MDLAAPERRGSKNSWSVGWAPSTGQLRKNRPREEVCYEYVMLTLTIIIDIFYHCIFGCVISVCLLRKILLHVENVEM